MFQHRKDPTAAAALVAAALASADPVVYSCGVAALRRLKSDDVEATLIKDATWSDHDLDQWLSHAGCMAGEQRPDCHMLIWHPEVEFDLEYDAHSIFY